MSKRNLQVYEGDVYEVLSVDGGSFEIRYGYYEDFERDLSAPVPIYPDLEKTLIYGVSNKRIVTFMQEPCSYYEPRIEDAETYCGCCKYYPSNKQMINACECKHNNLKPTPERSEAI